MLANKYELERMIMAGQWTLTEIIMWDKIACSIFPFSLIIIVLKVDPVRPPGRHYIFALGCTF